MSIQEFCKGGAGVSISILSSCVDSRRESNPSEEEVRIKEPEAASIEHSSAGGVAGRPWAVSVWMYALSVVSVLCTGGVCESPPMLSSCVSFRLEGVETAGPAHLAGAESDV